MPFCGSLFLASDQSRRAPDRFSHGQKGMRARQRYIMIIIIIIIIIIMIIMSSSSRSSNSSSSSSSSCCCSSSSSSNIGALLLGAKSPLASHHVGAR